MKPCHRCPNRTLCRVPGDLVRFDVVAHRLEAECRAPELQKRLHYYMKADECLVQAGFVDL